MKKGDLFLFDHSLLLKEPTLSKWNDLYAYQIMCIDEIYFFIASHYIALLYIPFFIISHYIALYCVTVIA